jgi:hypothetical protein
MQSRRTFLIGAAAAGAVAALPGAVVGRAAAPALIATGGYVEGGELTIVFSVFFDDKPFRDVALALGQSVTIEPNFTFTARTADVPGVRGGAAKARRTFNHRSRQFSICEQPHGEPTKATDGAQPSVDQEEANLTTTRFCEGCRHIDDCGHYGCPFVHAGHG